MDRNDRLDDLPRETERRTRATEPERERRVADDLRRDADVTGDEVGEAVGGISGVLTGAALGSLGGPLGTIIGGIAGAVSGWWAGKAIAEAARHVTEDDDAYYRAHYHASEPRPQDRPYDDVRPAYQIGHLAGRNPDYSERSFEDVEGELRHGWSSDVSARHGEWSSVRGYARAAYERGRTNGGTRTSAASSGLSAGAPAARSTERIDDTTDRIAMHERDVTGLLGDRIESAWDRTKAGTRRLADRAEDELDDAKDRIDGNPASRPGIDRTDDPDRRS